jgi:hypothetical protein
VSDWLAPILESETFTSRYDVGAPLGEGAMGVVFRARHRGLERPVALKFMRPGSLDDVTRRRFRREALLAAKLVHPNIVMVFDAGDDFGIPFIVFELVDGWSLRALLDSGPLKVRLALHIARQAALGLAAAHEHQILHRDVKPENILLDFQNQVKLADFGIARPLLPEPGVTGEGLIMGTPTYMSPEQAANRVLTGSSDQYALGIVLFEMLWGRPPFDGATAEILAQHLRDKPRLPEDAAHVSPRTRELVYRMLAKTPEERFPNMLSVSKELEALLADPLQDAAAAARVQPPRASTGTVLTRTPEAVPAHLEQVGTTHVPARVWAPAWRTQAATLAWVLLVLSVVGLGAWGRRLPLAAAIRDGAVREPVPTPRPMEQWYLETQDASGLRLGEVVGNRRSKIYHVVGVDRSNLPTFKNRVKFDTERAAQAGGYRRSRY